jgi:hypothetical protein
LYLGGDDLCDNASLPGVVPATNPISGGAGWDEVPGTWDACNRAKQSQFRGARLGRGEDCAEQTQFRRGNRPGLGANHAKQSQTWAGWDIWGMVRQGGANCAKQSQLAAERREGQVLHGKRVMVNWTRKRLPRNKPNSWRWREGLYKQTQFRLLCRSGDRRSRETNRAKQSHSSIADCGFRKACGSPLGLARAGCTNKPNSAGRGRRQIQGETKDAKRTQFVSGWPSPGELSVQNEPNFARAPGNGRGLPEPGGPAAE